MPLSKTGKKVLRGMQKRYGKKKGKRVFYATMRERNLQDEWEKKSKRGLASASKATRRRVARLGGKASK